ncbi:hypothetical protein ABW19_dt0208177 [Dactylella cylindrospora]|nr:hypothetical protein ABW19_dt0208177 [Dactylella cylindrospora]
MQELHLYIRGQYLPVVRRLCREALQSKHISITPEQAAESDTDSSSGDCYRPTIPEKAIAAKESQLVLLDVDWDADGIRLVDDEEEDVTGGSNRNESREDESDEDDDIEQDADETVVVPEEPEPDTSYHITRMFCQLQLSVEFSSEIIVKRKIKAGTGTELKGYQNEKYQSQGKALSPHFCAERNLL